MMDALCCVLIVRSSGESRPTEFGALRFKINGVIFAWSETICKSPLLGRTRAGPVCVVVQKLWNRWEIYLFGKHSLGCTMELNLWF